MKKLEKVVLMISVMISLNLTDAQAQWESVKSPSEQTMEQIQAEFGSLPSQEFASPELRATRPIDETPIGGVGASVPEIPVISIILSLLLYGFIKRNRLKDIVKI